MKCVLNLVNLTTIYFPISEHPAEVFGLAWSVQVPPLSRIFSSRDSVLSVYYAVCEQAKVTAADVTELATPFFFG